MADPVDEVTELLQSLIRNACVNDGTPASGHEYRNADLLISLLEGPGLDIQTYEPVPGRKSFVTRMEGSDPEAPSLALMGHLDVVPANAERWRHDPFGGELIDGHVWGRGAVDMLDLTAAMAVAYRRLADRGFRPRGDLLFLGVADEEAMGVHGAEWLTANETDAVRTDFVVTEVGGFRLPFGGSPRLPVTVAEKGVYWCTLRVRGTPGHASMPLRTDNALVKAADVVHRLAEARPETVVSDLWRRFVEGLDLDPDLAGSLLDPERIDATAEAMPDVGMARMLHASTHTTIAPTIMHAGVKTNVIPDTVDLQVDIRTLPGQTGEEIRAMLEDLLADLGDDVEIIADNDDPSTESPAETPLWDSLQRVTEGLVPGARNVPYLIMGATDARFFRRIGATAYGAALLSDRIPFAEFMSMFHGDDERVDLESLRLTEALYENLVTDLLG